MLDNFLKGLEMKISSLSQSMISHRDTHLALSGLHLERGRLYINQNL